MVFHFYENEKQIRTLKVQIKNLLNIKRVVKISLPKVLFSIFDKLKKEIQNFILRFCFYLNKKNEIQIVDYFFQV